MTEEQIWRWQGEMFVLASYLYYVEDYSIWSDEMFDQHCAFLMRNYDRLPQDLQQRITRDHLKAGTGFDLVFTEEDRVKAHEWIAFIERQQKERQEWLSQFSDAKAAATASKRKRR